MIQNTLSTELEFSGSAILVDPVGAGAMGEGYLYNQNSENSEWSYLCYNSDYITGSWRAHDIRRHKRVEGKTEWVCQ